ncbi:MAG: YgjV family protein [Monoglobales bacterium]
MPKLPFIIGITAVVFFLLCYQQKKRSRIILFNVISRLLYIIQYLLLGAIEGAVLDVAGTLSSLFAHRKNNPVIKKYTKIILLAVNLVTVCAGLLTYKNIFSLLPIIGVLLHTNALWLDDEKTIRLVSFFGSPFWLAYNIVSGAYGSCIGDFLSMVSIGSAIIRYDFKKKDEIK